jgi:tetratricopeptide (TPR) repeat protein
VALDPEFALAHARIGYAYCVTWNYPDKAKPHLERAFRLSDKLTEKDRLSIAAWYALANLDFPEAIRAYREIIRNYPLEVEAYWRLGHLLAGEEQTDEAIEVARSGLSIDPDAKELHNLLGGIYSELGRHDEAIATRQRYVALAPEEPDAHDSLGVSYQWAGRYPEALASYRQALKLGPDFDRAIVHLGNIYFQQGRYRVAIDQYQRYIAVASSDLERGRGYGRIAWVYWKKRDLKSAEQAARQELQFEETAVWNSVILALDRGNFARAEKLKEQLTKYPYTSRGARTSRRYLAYFVGYSALKKGRTGEAIERLKEAVSRRPPIWATDSYEDCLANAYLELGRLEEATAEYERILRLNPNYPLAQYHLAQAYESKGDRERARAAYERFLQIWKDADPDIPEVMEAKARLGRLRTGSAGVHCRLIRERNASDAVKKLHLQPQRTVRQAAVWRAASPASLYASQQLLGCYVSFELWTLPLCRTSTRPARDCNPRDVLGSSAILAAERAEEDPRSEPVVCQSPCRVYKPGESGTDLAPHAL